MTLLEIKQRLGVDLKLKNRKRIFVILRAIYINTNSKKIKPYHLAQELDLTNASILNLIKNFGRFKKDAFFEDINLAYKTKDFDLFREISLRKRDYHKSEYNKLYRLGERKPAKVKPKGILPHPKNRWHYLRIIDTLKKDNNHKLWDKPMPDFNIKDYKELLKLSIM